MPDARTIRQWIVKGSTFLSGMHRYSGFQTVRPKTRAVVIGGGFIGLETAENLIHRGFEVTLVEMGEQILGPIDPEMARIAEGYLERQGLRLALNDGVAGFEQGRIAADVIAGRDSPFRGTQGTAIIGFFRGVAAWTGASEKTLKRNGDTDYEKIHL